MTGYQYRGNRGAMSDTEVQRRVAAARTQASSNGEPPQKPTASAAPVTPPPAVPELKGAVKVERFPERSKYPFQQIADDGGIWKIDPGEFKVSPSAIKQAAWKWAQSHGLTVKCVEDGGHLYVQFKAAP